jgi:hypothetical protein
MGGNNGPGKTQALMLALARLAYGDISRAKVCCLWRLG